MRAILIATVLFACIPLAFAELVTVPNTLSNGTVADADEVNDNFEAVADGVNVLDTRVAILEKKIAQLEAQIAGLEQVYAIGDMGPAGGIVFYVTHGGRHGLEAAPGDLATGGEWGCFAVVIPGADGTAIGDGASNTTDMLAAGCSPNSPGNPLAADLVSAYSLNDFDDWYLPSIDELNTLYAAKYLVGGFTNNYYWSSSQHSANTTWSRDFTNGDVSYIFKTNVKRVRPVRDF